MQKIRVHIHQIRENFNSTRSCFIDLIDDSRKVVLPILVGPCEGQVIQLHFDGATPPRPFTHDLIFNMAGALEFDLREVVIRKFEEGIFYASLYWLKDGNSVISDSRTSDAIALAQRFDIPIYVLPQVIREAGVNREVIEDEWDILMEEMEEDQAPAKGLGIYTLAELEEQLAEALENEDYEKAARIRDEIEKRK
ncbi:MAG: bifunctional nuclease domain-containing protein [Bacteroidia bacterium]|jgi:bifunctional DNase/RNase